MTEQKNNNANRRIDIKSREFFLNKTITAESVEPIIKEIIEINRLDSEQAEKDPSFVRKPIKLIVDSFGGSIYCGNTLIGVIDSSETPVHTYCYGKAMSMGFMIYASGHKRFAHRLATFMYHDGGTTTKGSIEDIQLDLNQIRKLIDFGDEMLLENTKLSRRQLEDVKKFRIDWYMFADEAMTYGIVDEIIPSRRNKNKK